MLSICAPCTRFRFEYLIDDFNAPLLMLDEACLLFPAAPGFPFQVEPLRLRPAASKLPTAALPLITFSPCWPQQKDPSPRYLTLLPAHDTEDWYPASATAERCFARPADYRPMDSQPSQIHLPTTLQACRINALPPAAYYIADFISEEEEQALLHKVVRHRLFLG